MRGRELQVWVPHHLRCPISLEVMKDPVTLCTGITYDRHSIETWLDAGNDVCPLTNQRLPSRDLIPNHTLRRLIQEWCVANRSNGIERIPTPTVPLTSAQVARLLNDISRGGAEATEKLASLSKESERNRKCVASSKAPLVLAGALTDHRQSLQTCENALAVLATILPFDDDGARGLLASFEALRCITGVLRRGNPEGRTNAVSVLQEMAEDGRYGERIGAADGLAEGLVQLVRESICPAATKAGITTIWRISGGNRIRRKVIEAGAVPALLEILPEADRGVSEKALAALDVLCNCSEGRSAAQGHGLTVPVLVKKISRVSDLTTEFAVSVLWNTICHDSDLLSEALQVGAFQKLLVLVQLGCSGKTREKAAGLLKLFGNYRELWECADTMNLNQLKLSF